MMQPRAVGRLAWVVFAIAALAPPLAGQVSLRGGVNLTDWFGDDAGETERRNGLALGASVGLLRVGPIQLVAEVFYRQKGAGLDPGSLVDPSMPPESLDFGVDYIEVPVLLRVNLPTLGGRIAPYLIGGPAFAWRIDCGFSANAQTGTSGLDCDDLASENLGATLQSYDLGGAGGLGLDFALGGIGAIALEARYTGGLIGIGADGTDVRNRAFSVTLGYVFGLPGSF
ncbi:MAG: outer membrane beta-barrel protein [Gemmatimonadota bacterium]